MIRLSTDKQRILEELRELLDDEEPTVKHEAILQLAPCLKHATQAEVDASLILSAVQELYARGCKQVIPYELSVLMVEQSPRILHAIEPNPDLLDYMLAYFSKLVQT